MGLLEATNLIDPKTIRAMQARYGLRRDGILVGPERGDSHALRKTHFCHYPTDRGHHGPAQ